MILFDFLKPPFLANKAVYTTCLSELILVVEYNVFTECN